VNPILPLLPWFVLATGQGVDVATTAHALHAGHCVEANTMAYSAAPSDSARGDESRTRWGRRLRRARAEAARPSRARAAERYGQIRLSPRADVRVGPRVHRSHDRGWTGGETEIWRIDFVQQGSAG
jgi:hypothetical protein